MQCHSESLSMWLYLFFSIIVHVSHVNSANILGIMPTASYSHHQAVQPLWAELSLRGHSLTVVTTHPMKNTSLVNLTEIDVSQVQEIYEKRKFSEIASDENISFLEKADLLMDMVDESDELILSSPGVQNLIHDKNRHFDLLIVEALLPGMTSFSWRFNCPMIGISPLDTSSFFHQHMGNPNHPVVNPEKNLPVNDPENLTFIERLVSLIYNVVTEVMFNDKSKYFEKNHKIYQKYLGKDLPHFESLWKNIALMFINTSPIFQNVRPLNPNTIAFGGTGHIRNAQALPKDLQEFLDNSDQAAIYFSLGSNIVGSQMRNILEEILPVFSELPFRLLLKTDVQLENIPNNVKIQSWFPQQDVLRHPKVKLFITQGGLQSLQEAVYNAIPVIGIPFFGDQITNINKMLKMGYGIKIDKDNVTRESLKSAILEVINNSKYQEKAKQMSEILKDEEVPGLQRLIWWTEYVIRHKGADHLKSLAGEMPHWKYFMLDVLSFIGFIIFIIIFLIYYIVKYVYRLLYYLFNRQKLKKYLQKFLIGNEI
ncbi:hypothetical protein NQ317_004010 [Molorchus minor]|uniref:Glucuronosyltransferase n=1 Tax=Molorchus minor TaxID=1323400 RepID=A0ABQ9JSK3_9CUCU|nr:hypothetical protein NQ317_004010 [Molorchus minor]